MTSKAQSLKTKILSANDGKAELVDVPEWGVKVRLRALTGLERDHFENSLVLVKNGQMKKNTENYRARLLALCMTDEDGEAIFSESEATMLGTKNASVIRRLFEIASRLSGITEEDEAEMAGVFANGQSDASTSA